MAGLTEQTEKINEAFDTCPICGEENVRKGSVCRTCGDTSAGQLYELRYAILDLGNELWNERARFILFFGGTWIGILISGLTHWMGLWHQ